MASNESLVSPWDIHENAINALSREDLKFLNDLFVLYTSSLESDDRPSMNYNRFVAFLQDVGLISPSFTYEQTERLFARSVLSKLRTYIDADNQPALTFRLFLGAMLELALELFNTNDCPVAFDSLLKHYLIPFTQSYKTEEVKAEDTSYWDPQESCGDRETKMSLAACSAKVLTQSEQETAPLEYRVVERVRGEFFPKAFACIENQFRLFDSHGKGRIEKDEVYVLILSIAADLSAEMAALILNSIQTLPTPDVTFQQVLCLMGLCAGLKLRTVDHQSILLPNADLNALKDPDKEKIEEKPLENQTKEVKTIVKRKKGGKKTKTSVRTAIPKESIVKRSTTGFLRKKSLAVAELLSFSASPVVKLQPLEVNVAPRRNIPSVPVPVSVKKTARAPKRLINPRRISSMQITSRCPISTEAMRTLGYPQSESWVKSPSFQRTTRSISMISNQSSREYMNPIRKSHGSLLDTQKNYMLDSIDDDIQKARSELILGCIQSLNGRAARASRDGIGHVLAIHSNP